MAQKRTVIGEMTKGDRVRAYLAEHPDAMPKEVMAALAEQGVIISDELVRLVKKETGPAPGGEAAARPARKKKGARRKKKAGRRKKSAARQPAAAPQANNERLTAGDLLDAKRLADHLGGVAQAKRALELLERLR